MTSELMRWFTDAAYETDDADGDEWHKMLAAYASHIKSVLPSLPPDLARLAEEPRFYLHDAWIREFRFGRESANAVMIAEVGDLELTLSFTGAAIIPDNLRTLASAIGAEYHTGPWGRMFTFVMAHEVDLAPGGRFVVRIRLEPFHPFAIEFAGFSINEAPRPASSRTRQGRFVLTD
jgi:hypothetical protein